MHTKDKSMNYKFLSIIFLVALQISLHGVRGNPEVLASYIKQFGYDKKTGHIVYGLFPLRLLVKSNNPVARKSFRCEENTAIENAAVSIMEEVLDSQRATHETRRMVRQFIGNDTLWRIATAQPVYLGRIEDGLVEAGLKESQAKALLAAVANETYIVVEPT